MQEVIGYASYAEYKRTLDAELQRTTEGFVKIGYLLKVARDTDILKESGYASVNEFAKAEYGIDKTQVSRFIHINDRFSEGGYSDHLTEQYQGYGYAKLAIMLQLPDAVNEEITPSFSKSEVQAIKDEVDAENRITDLEVMMEKKDWQQDGYGLFSKVLHQLGKDDPELYVKLHDAVENTVYDGTIRPVVNRLMDVLAPAGEAIHIVRITGKGRKMLSIKGPDTKPTVTDIRTGEKQEETWDNLITDMEALCEDEDAETSWEKLYGEPFPKKAAPVQPHKEKPAPKKPSKVTKAKVEKPTLKPGPEPEEQLPGQDSMEEHPEWLPDGYEKQEVAPVQPETESENTGNTQLEEDSEEEISKEEQKEIVGYLNREECLHNLTKELAEVAELAKGQFYEMAKTHWQKAGEYLEELQGIS